MSTSTGVAVLLTVVTILATLVPLSLPRREHAFKTQNMSVDAQTILARCASLRNSPGPSTEFYDRKQSDRYEPGANATWIRHALIFTGERNGTSVIHGDLFLDKGIVKSIGKVPRYLIDKVNVTVVDANGAWVTPGLVDLHSHLGVLSTPILSGAYEINSKKGPVLPGLRSIDGFHTNDEALRLATAGGVTSILVYPGSKNAIGGEAFVMKTRKTSEGSPSSMVVEPHNLGQGVLKPTSWRHLAQACGDGLKHYGNRMDMAWALRAAYSQAIKMKAEVDTHCLKAEAGLWNEIDSQPFDDPNSDILVDVLRGKVKIHNQCSEIVDLDNMIRLSNEFKFPIASFQQAADAWLVPRLLNRTWGGTPAVGMFATRYRDRRETYRGSEHAPRILAENGIPVIMKTGHPTINSRYLIHEAQQAHYFNLPANLALLGVTATPAEAAGLSHRIGILEEGSDADVVIWDSHPLQIGATPLNVWIDGIPQFPLPISTNGNGKDDDKWRNVPNVPNWSKERRDTILWDGLPPLQGRKKGEKVVFDNVRHFWRPSGDGSLEELFGDSSEDGLKRVVIEKGRVTDMRSACGTANDEADTVVDLKGGSITPGLMSFGSQLGLEEIPAEGSTGDGFHFNAFQRNVPRILDDNGAVLRAMDALVFGTRDALIAFRSGVTLATASLARTSTKAGPDIIGGLSVTFRTGAAHAMERGAIVQDVSALHVVIRKPDAMTEKAISVSTQIAGLRRLLGGWESKDKETGKWFKDAAEGVVPLVVEVESADIMAALLILKAEVEDKIGSRMRLVFSGATEAHMLAQEIANAGVGVILHPSRPLALSWDQRRILPGPPLTNETTLTTLLKHGVTVGIGIREAWEARNTRFDLHWAALESNGQVDDRQAYALASTNLEQLLGLRIESDAIDMVAYEGGGPFDLSSKVVAVISPKQEIVEVF